MQQSDWDKRVDDVWYRGVLLCQIASAAENEEYHWSSVIENLLKKSSFMNSRDILYGLTKIGYEVTRRRLLDDITELYKIFKRDNNVEFLRGALESVVPEFEGEDASKDKLVSHFMVDVGVFGKAKLKGAKEDNGPEDLAAEKVGQVMGSGKRRLRYARKKPFPKSIWSLSERVKAHEEFKRDLLFHADRFLERGQANHFHWILRDLYRVRQKEAHSKSSAVARKRKRREQ